MKRFATLARIGTASVAAVALSGAVTGCASHKLLSVGPQPYVRPVARTAPPSATNLTPAPAPVPATIAALPIPAEMRPGDGTAAVVQPPPTENIVIVQEVPPAPLPTEAVKPLPPIPTPPAAPLTYTVKKGDTLWEIGRMYGVTMQEIAAINNRDLNGIIKPGDVLKLPAGAAFVPEDQRPAIKKPEPKRPTPPPAASTTRDPSTVKYAAKKELPADGKYVVQKGDTLSEIASMFGLSVAQIKQMNASIKGDTIFPEQTLVLRSGVTVVAPKTAATAPEGTTDEAEKTVKVEPVPTAPATTEVEFEDLEMLPYWCNAGDTLESIAKLLTSRVEWIQKANPTIKTDEDLKPRLKIMVPVPKDK